MKHSNSKYPDGIWIHCSAGRDGIEHDTKEIKRMHIEDNGWDDIGYHYLIEQINGIYQIVTGRGLEWQGSHVRGYNDSIGICVVGNFDNYLPHKDALSLLGRLVLGLLITFDMIPEDIHFHNEVSTKTCPGLLFPEKTFILAVKIAYDKCVKGL